MASKTVAKDIITLRGSVAIVSEFFGMLLCVIDFLDKPSFEIQCSIFFFGF